MRSILPFIILLLIVHSVHAQCELIIPNDATPIAVADTTVAASEGYYWVCEGLETSFTGDNSMILGESDSFIHVFGDNNTVVTKGAVMLHGMNTNVYALSAEVVDDMGTNSDIAICSMIEFDASQAPAGGCTMSSIAEAPPIGLTVYHDPAMGMLNIDHTALDPATLRIFDPQGRLVLQRATSGPTTVDVSAFARGIHVLTITTGTGEAVARFSK